MNEPEQPKKPTLLQLLGSVLAAFGGVQSDKNRTRDFNSDSAAKLILIGGVLTLVFIGLIIAVVKYVIV